MRTHVKVTRRKIGEGHYEVLVDDRAIGDVVHTGTHRDHYPWDWYLKDEVWKAQGRPARSVGAATTLRDGVQLAVSAYQRGGSDANL
jgi:hypothetical protein